MKSLQKVPLLKPEREAVETAGGTLQQTMPIERVILFGSKARGDADTCSDFDLLLLTAHPLHWNCVLDTFFHLGGFGLYTQLGPHDTIHFGEVH